MRLQIADFPDTDHFHESFMEQGNIPSLRRLNWYWPIRTLVYMEGEVERRIREGDVDPQTASEGTGLHYVLFGYPENDTENHLSNRFYSAG